MPDTVFDIEELLGVRRYVVTVAFGCFDDRHGLRKKWELTTGQRHLATVLACELFPDHPPMDNPDFMGLLR